MLQIMIQLNISETTAVTEVFFSSIYIISGSGFQVARNTGKKKDVATKDEAQADSP